MINPSKVFEVEEDVRAEVEAIIDEVGYENYYDAIMEFIKDNGLTLEGVDLGFGDDVDVCTVNFVAEYKDDKEKE